MDLNLIATAQHLPVNQLRFDQKAYERRVQRGVRRRVVLCAFWSRVVTRIGAIGARPDSTARLAAAGRSG